MKVNLRDFNKGPTERKLDVKIERWDTYSMDHTMALIILPMLLQLKQTKHGVPSGFTRGIGSDSDYNFCFDFIQEDQDDVFDQNCKEWDNALDKMIWSFQQLVEDNYDSKYHHGRMDIGWKPVQHLNPTTGVVEEMYEMEDKNPHEHWYDQVGHMLHEERIQEGLDLFGKHFRSLWD